MAVKLKSASLELILKANGKPIGDEIVAERMKRERDATEAEIQSLPRYMNSQQRRALRKCIERGKRLPAGDA